MKSKTFWVIAAFVVILIAASYFLFKPSLDIDLFGMGANFNDLGGINANDFITYRDPSGFSVAYPFSYSVENAGFGSPLKVKFTGGGEVMLVSVSNESIDSARRDILGDLDETQKKTVVEGQAFGARTMQFETDSAEGMVFVRHAFFACGSQNAILTAVVPFTLKGDLKAVNYMVSTFRC